MTRQELSEKIQAAYDHYLDQLDDLAKQEDMYPASPRTLQDDPRTSKEAAELWIRFSTQQNELNQEFFAPLDAHALAKQKAKNKAENLQAHLAQAQAKSGSGHRQHGT